MSEKLVPVDVSSSPELSRLVDEIQQSGVGRLLQSGDEPVAVIQPLAKNGKAKRQRRRYDPEQDPLLEIIGMFDSGAHSDIAKLKDQYIADAILPRPE